LIHDKYIHKPYQAVARVGADENLIGQEWEVKNRIERTELRFRMCVTEGEANSHSVIRCVQPHQLRVHMMALGWPILNDTYYPQLRSQPVDDYSAPLQLLAKELTFVDPISGRKRSFSCERSLKL